MTSPARAKVQLARVFRQFGMIRSKYLIDKRGILGDETLRRAMNSEIYKPFIWEYICPTVRRQLIIFVSKEVPLNSQWDIATTKKRNSKEKVHS